MAFYLALFNVNHVNDEVKHSVAHARRSKSVKPVLKDKNRRHSLSSTQDVADYRLLPKPRIIGSSHNIRRSPSPPPPHRRTSETLCNCDADSPENGRKKVTFDAEEASRLGVERPRRKLSEGSFLGNREALRQSLYTGTESSSQRAAEWIYSIHLNTTERRRQSQQEPLITINGSHASPSMGVPNTPPAPPIPTPTALPSPGPSIVLPIQCDHCQGVGSRCGRGCKGSSSVEPEPLVQSRPQSRLPSILRRRSTSDRSASLSTVFRRAIPYRSSSPNQSAERQIRNIGRIRTHHYHNTPESIPLIGKDEMVRSTFY